jgi:hypothetical protein
MRALLVLLVGTSSTLVPLAAMAEKFVEKPMSWTAAMKSISQPKPAATAKPAAPVKLSSPAKPAPTPKATPPLTGVAQLKAVVQAKTDASKGAKPPAAKSGGSAVATSAKATAVLKAVAPLRAPATAKLPPAATTSALTGVAQLKAVVQAKATDAGKAAPKLTAPQLTPQLVKKTSVVITGSMPLLTADHEILADATSNGRRMVAVQIERRTTENDLKRIASEIRSTASTDGRAAATTIVTFYLPYMKIGHGVWAHAYCTPEPTVRIVGLTLAEEERLTADARRDSRPLIGAWLTAAPAPVGKLTIYREKGRLFAEWGLRDGVGFAEEIIETKLPDDGGWRYDRRSDNAGDHLRLSPTGEMDLLDREGTVTATQAIALAPVDPKVADGKTGDGKSPDGKAAKTATGQPTIVMISSTTTTAAATKIDMPVSAINPVSAIRAPKPAAADKADVDKPAVEKTAVVKPAANRPAKRANPPADINALANQLFN